ncbi:unnamed protein product [Boreogadus saida]
MYPAQPLLSVAASEAIDESSLGIGLKIQCSVPLPAGDQCQDGRVVKKFSELVAFVDGSAVHMEVPRQKTQALRCVVC